MDAIIGCIMGYQPLDLANWVCSIDRSGFTGIKAVIYARGRTPRSTLDALCDWGFILMPFAIGPDWLPNGWGITQRRFMVERFRAVHGWLSQQDVARVVLTDVRDLVLQSDPFAWLDRHPGAALIVASEGVLCRDSPWARANYRACFPKHWQHLADQPSYCAGVLAGGRRAMLDLALDVHRLSRTSASTWQPPDQAALNALLSAGPHATAYRADAADAWATHLGTALDQADRLGAYRLEPAPRVDADGMVCNADGVPFCIVHQYDRIPGLAERIRRRLGD